MEPQFSNEDIQSAVALRRFPTPDEVYLEVLRQELQKTKPKPFDPNALHCIRWLRDNKLYDLVVRRPKVVAASTLLGTGNLRQKLEAMLLGEVPVDVIRDVISKYFGKEIDEEVIGYYAHYFWNKDLLDLDDWKALLDKYQHGSSLWSVYVASDPHAALLAVGEPLQLKPEDMLKYMTDQAFSNFRAVASADPTNVKTTGSAKTWADIALRGLDLQERAKSSTDTALQMLEMIMLRFSEDTPPSAEELQARGGKIIQMSGPNAPKRLTDGEEK